MSSRIVTLVLHYNGEWRYNQRTRQQNYVGGETETKECDTDFMGYFDIVEAVSKLVQWDVNQFMSLFWEQKIRGRYKVLHPLSVDKDIMDMLEHHKEDELIHIYCTLEQFEIPNNQDATPSPAPEPIQTPANIPTPRRSTRRKSTSTSPAQVQPARTSPVPAQVQPASTSPTPTQSPKSCTAPASTTPAPTQSPRSCTAPAQPPRTCSAPAQSLRTCTAPAQSPTSSQQRMATGSARGKEKCTARKRVRIEDVLEAEWERECNIDVSDESEDNIDVEDDQDPEFEVQSENSYHSLHSSSNEGGSLFEEETFEKGVSEQELCVGAMYDDIQSFRDALRQLAVKEHFGCQYIHNEQKRVTVRCKSSECTWRVHASRLQDGMTFQVKKMTGEHKCEAVNLVGNNMATSSWISNRIFEWIKDEPKLTVKAIKLRIRKMYAVDLNYYKIYRAKAMALEKIHGSSVEAFKKIPSLHRELLDRNPGSCVKYETRPDATFHRFYVSFRACIDGFKSGCRPILGLDGCHLKGKYEGVLLGATGMDANFGLYPVAFAVVDGETGFQWKWFLDCLKESLGDGMTKLTFISDKAKGLLDAVDVVFPRSEHRLCMRHFYKNFKKKHPGKSLERVIWQAARAYAKEIFKSKLELLKNQSEQGYAWVLSQNTEMWSRSSFGIEAKCHYITNNISESFNQFVGDERCRNYVDLIDGVRQKLMVQMYQRQRQADKWETRLVPKVCKYVQWISKEAVKAGTVYRSGEHEAEVDDGVSRSTVDLEARCCSCRLWQVSGFPCIHAAATILTLRRRLEDYVDEYFTVEKYKMAYSCGKIGAMPDKSQWKEVDGVEVLPCYTNRKRGRPKKNRIRDVDEPQSSGVTKSWKTCGRCGGIGHNRRRCDTPINPPPAPAASTSNTTSVSETSVGATRGRGSRGRGTSRGRGKGRGTNTTKDTDVHPFVRSTQ